jgi:CxxC motif-containing protein
MKTILVVYTNKLLSKREYQTMKRYSFNTSSTVKIGDLIKLDMYTTPVQVVDILSTCFKYVDIFNGKLSNKKAASTCQYEIREIKTETSIKSAVVV